jgi:integrase
LTRDEVKALIAASEPGLERCWLIIHLSTGARPGEVVGLRWSSIDLDSSTMVFIDAKHRNAERRVAIDLTTSAVIGGWMDEQADQSVDLGVPLIDDPWLISPETDASRPWARGYAGGFRWRALRSRSGIRDDLRLYDLRHTNNSELSALGFDAATRGDRIGNSPAVNDGIYSHSMRDHEAAAAVGEWLRSAMDERP